MTNVIMDDSVKRPKVLSYWKEIICFIWRAKISVTCFNFPNKPNYSCAFAKTIQMTYNFWGKSQTQKKNTITWIDFLAGEIPKRFQWDHTSLQKRKLISCNNAWEIHGVMILLYVISQISKHRQEHHLRGHYALLYTIEKITRILNKETSVLLQFSL